MKELQQLKRARNAILILSALLLIGLVILLCLHSCIRKSEENEALSVSSGNYISRDAENRSEAVFSAGTPRPSKMPMSPSPSPSASPFPSPSPAVSAPAPVQLAAAGDVSLALYALHAGDSEAFSVRNMFPGDTISKQYYLRAYCKNDIDVKFRVTVRRGYEKLAEVLMMRVEDPSTGELIYDGLMCDMDDVITRRLKASRTGAETLAYTITVYLDTSVGNDYMSLPLIADFEWWTEDRGNLVPRTSDTAPILLLSAVVLVCGAAATVLLIRKRRRDRDEEE